MIYEITYSTIKKELARLERCFREDAAMMGNDEWKWLFTTDFDDVVHADAVFPVADMSCVDVTGKDGVAKAEAVRSRYKETMMMIVADSEMSPMKYLKPSVMPASLLIRPYSDAQLASVVREFVSACMSSRTEATEEQYVVETRDGKTFLPLQKVLYFEASQKKILIRVGAKEYDTYDTIEVLSSKLPDYFIRCHRSYIVNKRMIDHIRLGEGLIYMEDGSMIPISRSYRAAVRALC